MIAAVFCQIVSQKKDFALLLNITLSEAARKTSPGPQLAKFWECAGKTWCQKHEAGRMCSHTNFLYQFNFAPSSCFIAPYLPVNELDVTRKARIPLWEYISARKSKLHGRATTNVPRAETCSSGQRHFVQRHEFTASRHEDRSENAATCFMFH